MLATAIPFRKGILFAISSAALALSPVSMAVAQAVADAKAGDDAELETVVVTGSIYLLGEVLARVEPARGPGEGRLQDF